MSNPTNPGHDSATAKATQLCQAVRAIHARGWAPGTGGNFSATVTASPLRLLITPSGIDKGTVTPESLLEVDESGSVLKGRGKPSAETLLHATIVEITGAGAVLHTHTPWNTLLSLRHREKGVLVLEGFEMLKGLSGVATHENAERIPILPNSQDMNALSDELRRAFGREPGMHGFLLAGHGLYTWGGDLAEARRHLEVLEFLFEVTARLELSPSQAASLY